MSIRKAKTRVKDHHVLLVEDNAGDVRLFQEHLGQASGGPFKVAVTRTLAAAESHLAHNVVDVTFLDLNLPDSEGLDTLQRLLRQSPSTPIIVLTGVDDEQTALDAVGSGAQDYLAKGELTGPLLVKTLYYAEERKRAENARRQMLERLQILHEIDTAILSAERTEEIADRALRKVVGLLGLDQGSVALFDFPADSCRLLTVCQDGKTRVEGDPFPLKAFRGDLGTLQAGQIEIVQDIGQRNTGEDDGYSLMRQQELRSFLSAPLLLDGELIGALNLASATPGAISDTHVDVAREVANQLAVALREERLDQQMQRQARQLREIMDAVPEGILLLDDDHRILSANRGARTLLADFIDFDGDARLTHLSNTALRPLLRPTEPGAPWRELRLDEGQRILELGVSTMSLPERQSGWVLVVRDVTQQREQEQYLQTQDRLAAVGQLASGIAHDFNNVMAIITLYSESLLRDGEHRKKEQYLATIGEQARHAANLIGQILDFSRHSVMKRQALNLRPFVKELVKLFERTLPENIAIDLTATEDDAIVEADPTRLQQALMNLAVNARDAMDDGGKLDLALDVIAVGLEEEPPLPEMAAGRWVTLAISDTGTGIAPEVASHLFEPFFTTKEKGKGTGLGLAQVYGIIKQHGGEIAVDTEVGRGTTFTIYLPAYQASSPSPESAAKESGQIEASGAGETILVVEDNEAVREAMVTVLKEMEFEVLAVADGQEALRRFEEQAATIDVVISDMVMPNVGGAELYERLHEICSDVTMILISGYLRDEAGKALLDKGGVFWIQKPFTAESLATAVHKALREEKKKRGSAH